MTGRSDNIIERFKEHLAFLHRASDDLAEQVTKSHETIERSCALLRLCNKIEGSSRGGRAELGAAFAKRWRHLPSV